MINHKNYNWWWWSLIKHNHQEHDDCSTMIMVADEQQLMKKANKYMIMFSVYVWIYDDDYYTSNTAYWCLLLQVLYIYECSYITDWFGKIVKEREREREKKLKLIILPKITKLSWYTYNVAKSLGKLHVCINLSSLFLSISIYTHTQIHIHTWTKKKLKFKCWIYR